jgi:hypothetical protein
MTLLPGPLRPKRSMPIDLALEADVLPPEVGDAGFDGHALLHRRRQNLVLVGLRLGVETAEAGHADDADSFSQFLRGGDGVLQFAAGAQEDGLQLGGFRDGDVAAL